MRLETALIVALALNGCAAGMQEATSPGSVDGAAASLVGTRWELVALGAKAITSEQGRVPFLILQSPNRVSGSDGCNQLAGNYDLNGKTLTLGPLLGTLMACPGMDNTDGAYRRALDATRQWSVAAGHLELSDANGAVLARFKGTTTP